MSAAPDSATSSSAPSADIDPDQLARLTDFFRTQTASPWSLADSLSVHFEANVIDIIRHTWASYGTSSASSASSNAVEVSRRTKSGLLLTLLGLPRKKRVACRQSAEQLLRKAATEDDVLIKTFAGAILPFMAADPKNNLLSGAKPSWGPSADVALDKWCPPFAEALKQLKPALLEKQLRFNPTYFRYLCLSAVECFRNADKSSLDDCLGPEVNIRAEHQIPTEAERMKKYQNWGSNRSANAAQDSPLKSTLPTPSSPKSSNTSPLSGHPPSRPVPERRVSSSSIPGRPRSSLGIPSKRPSMDRPAAPISRPAPKASKVKTLDLSEVVSADQAIIDAKKKEAEDLVKDQEKKKRELEEKRQAAREQKEREQEERRLQREKEQEERRLKRERERLEKEAKELERREIVERKRKAQEEQEEARKLAKTDGSQMPGSAPTAKRSSADPVEAFDSKRPKLSYPTPVQPVQIQPVQPSQPLQPVQQPVGVTPLMYQPIAQYATASGSPMPLLSNAGMMQYQPAAPQPLEQPIVSALVAPPAPPDLDAVIGPDTPLLTAENRELIRNFLSGRYERSKDKAEIKLSEAVIPDQVTGAMWVHTLFIVLDYDLCKWRKIKRRKKVA